MRGKLEHILCKIKIQIEDKCGKNERGGHCSFLYFSSLRLRIEIFHTKRKMHFERDLLESASIQQKNGIV